MSETGKSFYVECANFVLGLSAIAAIGFVITLVLTMVM